MVYDFIEQVLEYFEQLKTSDSGWEQCASALLSGQYEEEHIRFFCYQVIEHFITKRYPLCQDSTTRQNVRNFVINIMQSTVSNLLISYNLWCVAYIIRNLN